MNGDRLSSEPDLSDKWSVTIHTMVNFDGDGHGTGTEDGVCVSSTSIHDVMILSTLVLFRHISFLKDLIPAILPIFA